MVRSCNWVVLGCLWGLLLSGSCQEDTAVREENVIAEERVMQPQETNRYYHLVGSLGDLAITMELQEESGLYRQHGRYFRGFYRYDAYGGPIAVFGNLENGNKLILNEQGSWDGDPHLFEGHWEEGGQFSGLWRHSDGQTIHDFRLRKSNEAVPLKCFWLQDSVVVYPEWPASPILSYSLEWLDIAEQGIVERKRSFLRQQVGKGLLEKADFTDPNQLLLELKEERNQLYREFRDEMAAMRQSGIIDSLAEPESFLSFNYTYNTTVQVYFNSTDLLTLGYTDYSYTGGAHGMYATAVASYDIKNERVLQLSDVLLPGYVEAVSKALAKAVRTKYNLGDSTPLNTFLFEEDITPNDNYGFTDKGVFFVYAPYEIAPYAAGEIELFVAFDKIMDYVDPAWLGEEEGQAEE